MLDTLGSANFTPFLNQQCELIGMDGSVLMMTLTQVREVPLARDSATPDRRTPFNLVFHGPADARQTDGIYTLKFDALTVPGIFITRIMTVGPDRVSRFQAVFN